MKTLQQLETVLVHQLAKRGLRRSTGPLAFVYRGIVVRVTLKESLYRGLFVTVHDNVHGAQQFRAREGSYDWDAIARAVMEVIDRHREPARRNVAVNAPLSIRPSTASPGRLRVSMTEMDLDPVSVMQLYAVVRNAMPVAPAERPLDAAVL